jgi:hypothetical protein
MRNQSELGHPLFLPDDEDESPVAVSEIQIARIENGQQVFYPRVFPANELQSLEQVVSELGGGSYILIARNEGRITTRRKYVLPGKPKPMYDESRQETVTPPVSAPTPTSLDPMALMMSGQGGGLMPLIMLMMQQQQQAADRQMQMFLAMMQNTRESTAEEKAAARAEMNAQVERERISSEQMMGLMREALASKSGGGSEDFTRGVEFMRSFAAQQIETLRATTQNKDGELDFGSILETLGQVLQGASLLKGITGGGVPEGVPLPTPKVSAG